MYDALQKITNKGANQTARMRRLVCACVVVNPRRQVSRVQAQVFLMHLSL